MSLPSSNTNGQSSIRNFFRPKQPAYVAPPSSSKRNRRSSSSTSVPSPPPAASTTAAATTTTTRSAATTTTTPAITTSTTTATTATTRPANLHPQASISRIRPEHIPALRRITSLLLPVNYPDSFYARLSDPLSSGAFSRVVLWRDEKKGPSAPEKVIGGLVCRPEPSPFHAGSVEDSRPPPGPTTPSAQPNALYIQSLVLLSPYRGLGLAAALLDEVVADAARSDFACRTVWAHVWTQNDEGLRWYTARGFARVDEVKKYYHKLHPGSAWIVRREIGPTTLLRHDGTGADTMTGTVSPGPSVTAAAANLLVHATGGSSSSPSPSPGATPQPSLGTGSNPPPLPSTTATAPQTSTGRPPPKPLPNGSRGTPGQSFQNTRPETEWNDLPPDMQSSKAGGSSLSVPTTRSGASSRSSSSGRKKRDRAYPAAAFGNQG